MGEDDRLWQMLYPRERGTQESARRQDRCGSPDIGTVTQHQGRSCQAQ